MVALQTGAHSGSQEPQYISDKISRDNIIFEEHREGQVRFTQDGRLYKANVTTIRDRAPNVHINQGGELVPINGQVEPGGVDKEKWEATRKELEGFTWTVKEEGAAEDDVTVYSLGAVLPTADGRTYVEVRGEGGAGKHDFLVGDVREKLYYARVGFKYKKLPRFLCWPQIRETQFVIDFDVLSANAESYATSIR